MGKAFKKKKRMEIYIYASQVALVGENLPANAQDIEDAGLIPGQEDSLEEGMSTQSSTHAWRIP